MTEKDFILGVTKLLRATYKLDADLKRDADLSPVVTGCKDVALEELQSMLEGLHRIFDRYHDVTEMLEESGDGIVA